VPVPGGNFSVPRYRFRPDTFHTCFLVCKVWYGTLLPILWRGYQFDAMQHVPRKVVERYSFLFRRFTSIGGYDGPFHCTLLESLVLRNSDWYFQRQQGEAELNMSVECQRELVRKNPGLEILDWEGDEDEWKIHKRLSPLMVKDFEMLDNLQDLTLGVWDGSNGALGNVLRTVARTLEELRIDEVIGFKERDITTSSTLTGDAVEVGKESSDGPTEGGDRLVLGHVIVLTVPCFSNNTDLIYLAGCCPNLEQFCLDVAVSSFDMTRLANTLKNHCPKITILTISDGQEFDLEKTEREPFVGALIRGCSLAGLKRIEFTSWVFKPAYRDVLRSVLAHSATLEHVRVDYTRELGRAFYTKDILQVLVECRQLKSFIINGGTGKSVPAMLEILKSQPWGCTELEVLTLDIEEDSSFSLNWNCDLKFEEVDDEDEDEGRRGARHGGRRGRRRSKKRNDDNAPVKLSSGESFMGWYYHARDGFDDDADEVPKSWLRELFGMVKGLDRLLFLTLNEMTYTRSADPGVMAVFETLYDRD
ncbi:hypothetical protein BGW39_005455, partial [Mortierella sp. 14UC]